MKKILLSAPFIAPFIFSTVVGCTGNVLDVPSSKADDSTDDVVSPENPLVYRGYTMVSRLPSRNEKIRLTLTKVTESEVEGTITFGDENAQLPPVDASTIYPSDASAGTGAAFTIFEGFAHPLRTPTLEGKRLRFGVDAYQPYEPWCVAQTPYLQDDGVAYNCTPRADGGVSCPSVDTCYATKEGEDPLAINFGHHQMCASGLCECDASKCWLGPSMPLGSLAGEYDLRFDGNELNGIEIGGAEVFLTKE